MQHWFDCFSPSKPSASKSGRVEQQVSTLFYACARSRHSPPAQPDRCGMQELVASSLVPDTALNTAQQYGASDAVHAGQRDGALAPSQPSHTSQPSKRAAHMQHASPSIMFMVGLDSDVGIDGAAYVLHQNELAIRKCMQGCMYAGMQRC